MKYVFIIQCQHKADSVAMRESHPTEKFIGWSSVLLTGGYDWVTPKPPPEYEHYWMKK